MNRNACISIIIPVYNVELYIVRCLESVMNQTYKNLEIIIVDDGSPDNCGKMVEEFALKDNRIKVIHQKNQGLSAARNEGIKIATGEYYTFIDSDDFVHPELIQELYKTALASNADIVMCGYQTFASEDAIKEVSKASTYKVHSKNALMGKIFADEMRSYAWGKLYKRELFQRIKYPVNRLFEDVATTYLLLDQCSCIASIASKLYFYFVRSDAITNTDIWEKWYHLYLGYKEMYQYAIVNYPEYSAVCLGRCLDMALAVCNKKCKGLGVSEEAYYDVVGMLKLCRNNIKLLKNIKKNRRAQLYLWAYCTNVTRYSVGLCCKIKN